MYLLIKAVNEGLFDVVYALCIVYLNIDTIVSLYGDLEAVVNSDRDSLPGGHLIYFTPCPTGKAVSRFDNVTVWTI